MFGGKKDNKDNIIGNPTCEWEKIPRENSEKQLELASNAKQDAHNHDFTATSVTEGEITALAYDYKDKNQSLGAEFFQILDNNCTEIVTRIENSKKEFEKILERAKGAFNTKKNNYITRLKTLSDHKIKSKQRLDLFKLSHNRDEDAHAATKISFLVTFALVVIFAAVEISANTILIGGVVVGGANEGMTLSIAVALVNVLLSSLIGYFVVKHIHNINSTKKSLAYLVLAVWIPAVIIYMNWCVGALRTLATAAIMEKAKNRQSSISTEEGEVATKATSETTVNIYDVLWRSLEPWNLNGVNWDFTGVLLVFLGMSFAIISLVKAYMLDGTYPGYGKVTRTFNNAGQSIKDTCDEFRAECNELRLGCIEEKNTLKSVLEKENEKFSVYTNAHESEAKQYERAMKNNIETLNHMYDEYRAVAKSFLNAENKPVPERFEKKKVFYKDEEIEAKIVFEESMHWRFDDGERTEKRKHLNNELTNSANLAEEKILELVELMNKETTEVQKKYDV